MQSCADWETGQVLSLPLTSRVMVTLDKKLKPWETQLAPLLNRAIQNT